MTVKPVIKGILPNADHQNALIRQSNANVPSPTGAPIQTFPNGYSIALPRGTVVGLFLVTEGFSGFNTTSTPYTENANLLWLDHHGADDYFSTSYAQDHTLYHPTAFVGAASKYIGLPPYGADQRCFAWYNCQACRWEILAPAVDLVRFELTAALAINGSATAYLREWISGAYSTVNNIALTVHDGMNTFHGTSGKKGYVKYYPDADRWEIINMECP